MKTIKFLLYLIILGLFATLVYQNKEYFMTATALHIDLNVSSLHYTAKALPNIAYWGICFGLGLLFIGIRGLFTAFRLGREVKQRDARIEGLQGEINGLQARLDVFIHDPYIKRKIERDEAAQAKGQSDETPADDAATEKEEVKA
ncbi:MAG: hypothetical protein V6Z89_06290 [Desulfobacter sp.]